jgi:hypothetical protein
MLSAFALGDERPVTGMDRNTTELRIHFPPEDFTGVYSVIKPYVLSLTIPSPINTNSRVPCEWTLKRLFHKIARGGTVELDILLKLFFVDRNETRRFVDWLEYDDVPPEALLGIPCSPLRRHIPFFAINFRQLEAVAVECGYNGGVTSGVFFNIIHRSSYEEIKMSYYDAYDAVRRHEDKKHERTQRLRDDPYFMYWHLYVSVPQ